MDTFAHCPFCHERFASPPNGPAATCPLCDVALIPASVLAARALSLDDEAEDAQRFVSPGDRQLPWTYVGHGRGWLVLFSVAGLVAFGLPWVRMYTPERVVFSGVDVAARTGLSWSGAVAWFTLLPLVLSRRTLRAMRGARLAAAVLSAIPAILAVTLLAHPPTSAQARGVLVRLRFDWGPGIFLTLGLGVAACAISAVFFGGKTTKSGGI